MNHYLLSAEWIHGAVSIEYVNGGLKPWRIPYEDYELYPPDGIGGKAELCAGIRIRMQTNATTIVLEFKRLTESAHIDYIEEAGEPVTLKLQEGETQAIWQNLCSDDRVVDIWLPQNIGMTLFKISVNELAYAKPRADSRPKWITYGSSITQCVAAHSPASTWPAIAARAMDYNLTCLGYSGNCQLETMVARMIRDLPADCISLCLGINVYGAESLSARTLRPAIIGMLETIREKHVKTPIYLISPIYATEREITPNQLGLTVQFIRNEVAEAAQMLQRRGDRNLYYRDGRQWFGEADASLLSDGLHPNAEGYRLLGERFEQCIFEKNL